MIWIGYNILFIIGFCLLLPRFLWRMLRRGGYRRHFGHRWASYDADTRAALRADTPCIWMHAVSVGELFVAFRLMEALRASNAQPQRFVLTTTTSTGHALARQRIQAPDVLLYFPVDLPFIMRRAFRHIRPSLVCLVECELWPNLIRCCAEKACPLALVNGRISHKSFAGYRWLRVFTRRLLPEFNVLCMQSESDRQRVVHLGARPDRTHAVGSAKYELDPRDPEQEAAAARVLQAAGITNDHVLVLGGSTWPGEEEILARWYQAQRDQFPALRLALAPRHAERANEVLALLARLGLRVARRSTIEQTPEPDADVVLIDTTGELRHFYAHAAIVFVGKSLTAHGGQNMIEPAALGKAVVVGPHMENFAASMEDFKVHDAIVQVTSPAELEAALTDLLAQPGKREALATRAGQHVARKSGAMETTLRALQSVLPGDSMRP